MIVKQHAIPAQRTVIDLTRLPYFAPKPEPLVLQEASGLERVRDIRLDEGVAATYRIDRTPGPVDDTMHFGGLGLAAVMNVGAHPIRAQLRRISVLSLVAIATVAGVALVMLTMVRALRP